MIGRVLRIGVPTVVVLAAIYGWLAYRYWSNTPRLSHNYAAELNAEILATPEDRRAWPIYREALLELAEGAPEAWRDVTDFRDLLKDDELVAHLRRNAPAIAKIQRASQLPSMGYPLSDVRPPEDVMLGARHFGKQGKELMAALPPEPPSENPTLFGIQSMPASELREAIVVLCADAFLAAGEGDETRTADNLAALIALAEQLREIPEFMFQTGALHWYGEGLRTWGLLMAEHPEAFSKDGLLRLEQAASRFSNGQIQVAWSVERREFADLVQRVFSDDGTGDGRFRETESLSFVGDNNLIKLRAPLAAYFYLSRRRTTAEFDRLMGLVEAQAARPLWQSDFTEYRNAVETNGRDPRHYLLNLFASHLDHWYRDSEQAIQQRDAIIAVSAALRYRHANRKWPATLDALVPEFMPALPIDRMTGEPLRYVYSDERPTIYSVGTDKRDDGGRAARVPPSTSDHIRVSDNLPATEPWHWAFVPYWHNPPDGDLILWPVAPRADAAAQDAPKP